MEEILEQLAELKATAESLHERVNELDERLRDLERASAYDMEQRYR